MASTTSSKDIKGQSGLNRKTDDLFYIRNSPYRQKQILAWDERVETDLPS
jgi:hypothetical protein